ncbi:MAG TPA: DUF4861 family protein [Phycisphaerae bacterium]|nr:DUF4861 family protein [Phycisphaerae bacterium]
MTSSPANLRRSWISLTAAVLLSAGTVSRAAGQAAEPSPAIAQQLFERVFGDAVKLDPVMVAKVKAAKPGQRFFVDRDGDGKKDECWFIDDSPRHQEQNRPILVRAIDPNGIDEVRGPNLSSTLYVADWRADGTVDVVLEYVDQDQDGDLDKTAFYFYMPQHSYFGKDVLRVWWGRDDGDDNLLWYDVDYNYYQNLCQYRCHFSGEETFVAFGLLPEGQQWLSAFENPFLFYDPDNDGCSEIVLRIEGHNDEVRAIRYSFDIDDDAFGRRTHDYDFSVTAYADADKPLKLPADALESTTLHGLPTQPWLRRDKARAIAEKADCWVRKLLTWDEMNANTEGNIERDPFERWEGVIAHGNDDFKQVGGPACSVNNKRFELSLKPVAPMRLYYDETDQRMHLLGATKGWLHVDFDFDGKVDAEYTWADENGDGVFDRRRIDVDADGTIDFDWPMQTAKLELMEPDWDKLRKFYPPVLNGTLLDSQAFIDAAKSALGHPTPDPAEVFFLTKLTSWTPRTGLGAYMRKSPAGAMYYVGLVRDRLMAALGKKFGSHPRWSEFEKFYAGGDYREAAYFLVHELAETPAHSDKVFGAYSRRLPIRIDNSGQPRRMDWPITITYGEILKTAPDFNPDVCAVVAPQRWLGWRETPHQIDTIEQSVGRELSFLVDLPDNDAVTYYLCWGPSAVDTSGEPPERFHVKTATAEDWVPPNIGWESNRVGYRMYWGQFDFFGKKIDGLIYPTIGKESYHSEVAWGIDALHVGGTCGLGGIWVYKGEKAMRLYSPAGKGDIRFTKRQVVSGPVRAAIEVTGTNIDPEQPDMTAKILCTIYAERSESEIRVSLTKTTGPLDVAPGLCKLPREKAFSDKETGYLGAWGFQEPAIDEIGMAVIVPPEQIVAFNEDENERRVRCRTSDDHRLRYWIVGDWRRGRQHPIAPTIDNWRRETRELAGLLNNPPAVVLEQPEEAR